MKVILTTIVSLLTTSFLFGQNYSNREILGQKEAIKLLKQLTANRERNYVYGNEFKIITDTISAVKIAEIILFKRFGKTEILKQRPYEIYFLSDFWYIRGTIQKEPPNKEFDTVGGGQFNIIIDGYDCKVIYLSSDE